MRRLKTLSILAGRAIASVIDLSDVIYAGGVALVALGAGWFHPGAGLICAGLGTTFPFVVMMLSRGTPPKDKP
jgi:hypothetical protein